MVSAMQVNETTCRQAASDPLLLATDLADYLVRKGVPFREAHELVGKAVAASEKSETPLDQMDLGTVSSEFSSDASEVFSLESALRARTNPGSPSVENVQREVERWQTYLQ